jgi:hypothetical protein
MTINTTLRRWPSACLMASIGLVVALAWAAGDAPAKSQDRRTWAGYCEAGYVCLYQDADGHGRRIHFNRPGTYKLKNYGMGPGRKGVSSFWNRGRWKATLIIPNWRINLHSHANVRRSLNDQATYVRLQRR